MLPEEEAWRLFCEISPFLPFFFSLGMHFSHSLYLSLILMLDSNFFQGLNLLKRASDLRKEAQQLESEGLQKIESAVAGSEAEDFYGLLRGAISHTPISSVPPPPKNAILPQLPLSPSHPLRSLKRWHLKSLILLTVRQSWHWKPPLQLSHDL